MSAIHYTTHYRGPDGNFIRFKKRKSRFTYQEVELLLTEVQKKRHILIGRFNRGVSKELKHRTWTAVTERINEVSECHREVIEVIKKWADLKCDTKRRVAAMKASGATTAQIAQVLSPLEAMVNQILQMTSKNKTALPADDQMDDDDDILDVSEMPHSSSGFKNGMPHTFGLAMPPPIHARVPVRRHVPPTDMTYSYESAVPLTDLEADTSEKEDGFVTFVEPGVQKDHGFVNPQGFLSHPSAEKSNMRENLNHGTFNGRPATGVVTPPSGEFSSRSVPVFAPPPVPSRPAPVDGLREHLAQSASHSLQEQQATTRLIGSLSRSLESLAESVQRLVQTQKQFSRDSLELQRDTLHVLRDFSSSALTLLQDKTNGHP